MLCYDRLSNDLIALCGVLYLRPEIVFPIPRLYYKYYFFDIFRLLVNVVAINVSSF